MKACILEGILLKKSWTGKMSKEKQELREAITNKRRGLPRDVIVEKSRRIIDRLKEIEGYKNANTIMSYISLDVEVDTKELIKDELIKQNKVMLVPFVEENKINISKLDNFENLVKGKFGVFEPKKKERYDDKIDLIIVPGVVFDEKGSRIGFGRGYYDKLLSELKDPLKIGLAFEEQIVDFLPTEEHDMPVDIIITEKRVINCK